MGSRVDLLVAVGRRVDLLVAVGSRVDLLLVAVGRRAALQESIPWLYSFCKEMV